MNEAKRKTKGVHMNRRERAEMRREWARRRRFGSVDMAMAVSLEARRAWVRGFGSGFLVATLLAALAAGGWTVLT